MRNASIKWQLNFYTGNTPGIVPLKQVPAPILKCKMDLKELQITNIITKKEKKVQRLMFVWVYFRRQDNVLMLFHSFDHGMTTHLQEAY